MRYCVSMWPFRQKSAEMLEPEPLLVDRKAALLSELHQLKAELTQIDRECLQMRAKYGLKIDRLLQVVGMQIENPTEVQRVRDRWRALQFKARPRLTRWSEVQKELAELAREKA